MAKPQLRTLHAVVMEKCMRSVPGKSVGIDSLLARKRCRKIQLTAVFWAAPTFGGSGCPEIREMHFLLDEKSWNLQDYHPAAPTDWSSYIWKITPDGDLNAFKTTDPL